MLEVKSDLLNLDLLVPGYFRLVHIWQTDGNRSPVLGEWKSGMRSSKNEPIDSCKIAFACDYTFIHGCQTDHGTSGASVLRRNMTAMVGRHLGTTDLAKWGEGCRSEEREGLAGYGNYGVLARHVDNQMVMKRR